MRLHLIVLAAGSARRFGSNKLLVPLNGKPLFRHALDAAADAISRRPDADLTVVSRYEEILRYAADAGFSPVSSPDSGEGISRSIRAGVHSLGRLAAEDYLIFLAADQPFVSSVTIGRLLDCAALRPLTACVCFGGVRGNPVLFSASLADELCALDGDRGGKSVLLRHPDSFLAVEAADPRELLDVDELRDLP